MIYNDEIRKEYDKELFWYFNQVLLDELEKLGYEPKDYEKIKEHVEIVYNPIKNTITCSFKNKELFKVIEEWDEYIITQKIVYPLGYNPYQE